MRLKWNWQYWAKRWIYPVALIPVFVFGQNSTIDSLKLKEASLIEGPSKVDVYNELAMALYDYDTEAAYQYSQNALKIAEKFNYRYGKQRAIMLNGIWFYTKGDHRQAMQLFRTSLSGFSDNESQKGYNLNLIGNIFRGHGEFDSAAYYYEKAISILEKTNDKFYLSIAYKSMGRLLSARWKMDEAMNYFQKSLKLRLEIKYKHGIADAYFVIASVYINQGNYEKAGEYLAKGCETTNQSGDLYQLTQCYYYQSDLHSRTGEYTKALTEIQQALTVLEKITYYEYRVSSLMKLGEIYENLGQYDLGLESYFKALKIAERMGMQVEQGAIYSGIAWLYKNQNDFGTAWEYIEESHKVRARINDEHGLSNVYNVKGLIKYQLHQYDSAIPLLQESIRIRKELNNLEGIAASTFNLALVYEDLKDFKKALQLQIEGLKLEEAMGDHYSLGISYNAIAGIYLKMNELNIAEQYIKLGEYEGNYTQSKLIQRNNLELFASLYEKRGDLKKALYYQKRYQQVNDSLYTQSSSAKAAELRSLYQLEKKQQEIQLLNQQKQLQDEQIRQQQIVIGSSLAGLALLVIAGSIGYRYYRVKTRTNEELQKLNREISEQKEEIQSQSEELMEANQIVASVNKTLELKIEERTSELKQAYKELDTFFYRSSHDFRRPLTTFLGLAEVAKVTVKDSNSLELFEKVRDTAVNLDRMLIKLQSISDLGTQQLVFKEVFIKELIEQIMDHFRNEIAQYNVRWQLDGDFASPFYSYPALVKIILENVLENAVNFSAPEDARIFIKAQTQREGLHLTIGDNGVGILPQYQDRIFEMYFRANEKSKGNGLGLYIVQKALQKLNGTISFESIYTKGSTFKIFIPSEK